MLGVFLDTETNGLSAFKHKVVEIAFKIVDVLSGEVLDSYEALLKMDKEAWDLSDPASLHINGFTYSQVSQGKLPSVVAGEIRAIFKKHHIQRGSSVFICQNPSFDRSFFSQLIAPELQEELNWPYHWLDLASMYWVVALRKGRSDSSLFPWVTGISKNKIAAVYGLSEEEMPHRAMNGVDHLILCYQAVVKQFL